MERLDHHHEDEDERGPPHQRAPGENAAARHVIGGDDVELVALELRRGAHEPARLDEIGGLAAANPDNTSNNARRSEAQRRLIKCDLALAPDLVGDLLPRGRDAVRAFLGAELAGIDLRELILGD